MAGSTPYRIGRALGRLPRWALLGILLLLLVLIYRTCSPSIEAPVVAVTSEKGATSTTTSTVIPPDDSNNKQICQATIEEGKAKYAALFKEKKYWDAALAIRNCADLLATPDLQKLVREAEIASHLAEINNPKTPPFDRARAMQMLARDYPDVGAKYEALAVKLLADSERQDREAEKKRRRSEGVRIGMSKEDVLASSWGRPESINTTTTVRGSREQWVYGGRSYLYFENGVLTAIQN